MLTRCFRLSRISVLCFTVALATALLALAACGPTPTPEKVVEKVVETVEVEVVKTVEVEKEVVVTATPAPAPVENVTLLLWDITEAEAYDAWWETFLADFEAAHPGVTVNKTSYETVPYDDKLLAAMAVNEGPDIFYNIAGESVAKYIRAGKAAPLDDLIDTSNFSPGLVEALKYDGKLYGVPIAPYTLVLWYNKGVFADQGITPPTTWDEFTTACDTLKAAGITPITLGNTAKWPFMIYYDYFLYQYGGPGIMEKASFGTDGASWTDEPFVKAAQRVTEFVDAGYFPDAFNSFDHGVANGLMFNGQAGMDLMGSWLPGVAGSEAPEGFEMGFLYFPTAPDAKFNTDKGGGLSVGLDMFAINAASEHKELAAELLNEFGKRSAEFSDAIGNLPASPAAKPSDPSMAALAEAMASASYAFGSGDRMLPAPLVDDYLNNLQALSLGDLTPEEFAKAMADAAEAERSNFK